MTPKLVIALLCALFLYLAHGGSAEVPFADTSGSPAGTDTMLLTNTPSTETDFSAIWTSFFTQWTNRFGTSNPSFTNALSWNRGYTWGTNRWWANFATFTNGPAKKGQGRGRILHPPKATATDSQISPAEVRPAGSESSPQFPKDVKAMIEKFQKDRQQLMSQMKAASDQDRERILGQLKDMREQIKQQMSQMREQMRDQVKEQIKKFNDNRLQDAVKQGGREDSSGRGAGR